MVKKLYLTAVLLIMQVTISNAQNQSGKRVPFEDLRKKKVFRISPFHLFNNQFNFSGEFFNSNFTRSRLLTASIMYADNDSKADGGFSLDYMGRVYPRGFRSDSMAVYNNGASGFYMGFGLQAGYCEFRDKNLTQTVYKQSPYGGGTYPVQVGVNVMTQNIWVTPYIGFGYQFILWESLYADLFVGGGVKMNRVSKTSPDKSLDLKEFYGNPDITERNYQGIIPKVNLSFGVGF